MFLIIPLSLVIISIIGITVIILRKKSYLSKLYTLNTAGNGGNVSSSDFSWKTYGGEFFPELQPLLNKIGVKNYKSAWLMEIEKFLRKSRVVFLRFDRISDSMIKRIRKIHLNDKLGGHLTGEVRVSNRLESDEELPAVDSAPEKTISPIFLKNEEERLIMEIAKNPKDARLYQSLGDLYMEMNNFTDAKESFEAAVELDPQNELFKVKLSSALEKIVKPE